MHRQRKKRGQALVEFALFATLLMMMLSAVIDLGLAFFAHQGLSGAALEGVTYAAMYPNGTTPGTTSDREIERRVHFEGGADANLPNRALFVNLRDLNNDGTTDSVTADNPMILIAAVTNTNSGSLTCTIRRRDVCDMVVTVNYTFKAKFFMASIFGLDQLNLSATRQMTIQ